MSMIQFEMSDVTRSTNVREVGVGTGVGHGDALERRVDVSDALSLHELNVETCHVTRSNRVMTSHTCHC